MSTEFGAFRARYFALSKDLERRVQKLERRVEKLEKEVKVAKKSAE